MSLLPFLTVLVPSLGLSLAVGYAREWVPFLLALYYLAPLGLYGLGEVLGRVLRPFPFHREEAVPLMALLVPYALFWLGAGFLRIPLPLAYASFLRGPGLAVPLVVLLAWPLGYRIPPALASLLAFGLFLLAERGMRWVWRRV